MINKPGKFAPTCSIAQGGKAGTVTRTQLHKQHNSVVAGCNGSPPGVSAPRARAAEPPPVAQPPDRLTTEPRAAGLRHVVEHHQSALEDLLPALQFRHPRRRFELLRAGAVEVVSRDP